jgi:hypothetical protein
VRFSKRGCILKTKSGSHIWIREREPYLDEKRGLAESQFLFRLRAAQAVALDNTMEGEC